MEFVLVTKDLKALLVSIQRTMSALETECLIPQKKCICSSGFYGANCDKKCPDCGEYGSCVDGVCTCDTGYELFSQTECRDIDECKRNLDDCDSKTSSCKNMPGYYMCLCKPGFSHGTNKDMKTCVDIDECSTVDCGPNGRCVEATGEENGGEYTCECDKGFVGGGKGKITKSGSVQHQPCVDFDECERGIDNCAVGSANCINTPGNYECECKDHYTGDGRVCVAITDCAGIDCGVGGKCIDKDSTTMTGEYFCTCEAGYEHRGWDFGESGHLKGTPCTDIDECQNVDCGEHSKCTHSIGEKQLGQYKCVCDDGYKGGGFGTPGNPPKESCVDIDECSSDNDCHEHSSCTNVDGSYICTCKVGYRGDGKVCEEFDVCQEDYVDCGEGGTCSSAKDTNIVDGKLSYTCTCADGYSGGGTGNPPEICIDIDECSEKKANGENENSSTRKDKTCHKNASCTNTKGSFECKCLSGYKGDGFECEDINECLTKNGGCGNPERFVCRNQEGQPNRCVERQDYVQNNIVRKKPGKDDTPSVGEVFVEEETVDAVATTTSIAVTATVAMATAATTVASTAAAAGAAAGAASGAATAAGVGAEAGAVAGSGSAGTAAATLLVVHMQTFNLMSNVKNVKKAPSVERMADDMGWMNLRNLNAPWCSENSTGFGCGANKKNPSAKDKEADIKIVSDCNWI
ncbi:MAG: hypothetical protein CMI56_00705 [Parcubacteria group bacterium]|nr:hypothetical protein [Parcubacteria group bacterium]